jgi:hypothetical protein
MLDAIVRFTVPDAGKRISGRNRHIMTYTDVRLLAVEVHAADTREPDGPKSVRKRSCPGGYNQSLLSTKRS